MSDPPPDQDGPDDLSEALIQRINGLRASELQTLRSYIDERIESLQPPIEEEVRATAAGEVIAVDDHEGYVLARIHPLNPDGPGVNTEKTELYHVSREQHPDGTDSLHWSYIGDVQQEGEVRCESCGRSLDVTVDVCPHCGSDQIVPGETEE